MASSIDTTKPVQGAATTLSVRDNFSTAKTEIEALQTGKADLASPTFTGTATFAGITATGVATFSGATTVPVGTVTAHEAALTITESQVSDIGTHTHTGVYEPADATIVKSGGTETITATWTFANVDINGGTIDGTTVGATTQASGDFTTLSANSLAMFGEIAEAVAVISGPTPDIDPADGTIQTWTLTGASTPTESLAQGEYVTLMIDTPSYDITWTMVDKWIGGSTPTLDTTAGTINIIEIWQVDNVVYGAYVGAAS